MTLQNFYFSGIGNLSSVILLLRKLSWQIYNSINFYAFGNALVQKTASCQILIIVFLLSKKLLTKEIISSRVTPKKSFSFFWKVLFCHSQSSCKLITSLKHIHKILRSKTEENWGENTGSKPCRHERRKQNFDYNFKATSTQEKSLVSLSVDARCIAGYFQLLGLICGNTPEQIVQYIILSSHPVNWRSQAGFFFLLECCHQEENFSDKLDARYISVIVEPYGDRMITHAK